MTHSGSLVQTTYHSYVRWRHLCVLCLVVSFVFPSFKGGKKAPTLSGAVKRQMLHFLGGLKNVLGCTESLGFQRTI